MSTISVFAGQPAESSPNAPLVSTDDFTEWFSIPSPTGGDLARMQTAIEIASAEIRNGRRIFSPVTNDVVLIDAHGGDTLLLPKNRLPVTSVSLVEELIGTTWTTIDQTTYDWSADGYVERWWTWWSSRPAGVRVTYSHGYADIPREVAGVCLSLAKRLYDNPDATSIQSEQLGDHHVTYQGAQGGLSPLEVDVLRQYEAMA